MRVGIFGGTGFVGAYLIDALLARGHQPILLVRQGTGKRDALADDCELIPGEISDKSAVNTLVNASDALVYNIGILREFPGRGITFEDLHFHSAKLVMDMAAGAGGKRFLLMSANGVRPEGTGYQRTKYRAEEHLRGSGLDYSIFRPSVIFGPPRGRTEIATQLLHDIIRPPLPAPLFYSGFLPVNAGGFRLAPIQVEEVAAAFADALNNEQTIGKTYLLCGPEELTWREILKRIAEAAGRPGKLMVPVPADLLRLGASLLDRFEAFPVTADQLKMLLAGNTCDMPDDAIAITGQRRFDDSELAYLSSTN